MNSGPLIFGMPWQVLLVGLGLLAAIAGLAWLNHRWNQSRPSAQAVKALGWTYEDSTQFEGPLLAGKSHKPQFDTPSGMPLPPAGGNFWFSTGGDLTWQDRDQATPGGTDVPATTLYYWRFKGMHVRGFHPASDAQLQLPTANQWPHVRLRWDKAIEQMMGQALAPEQVAYEFGEHSFSVVVSGIQVNSTQQAIRLASACIAHLKVPI